MKSTIMELTEDCRVSFDYVEGHFNDMAHANRALAWCKDMGLQVRLDRSGDPWRYRLIMVGPPAELEVFWPNDAAFTTWRDYAKSWAERLAFEAWQRAQSAARKASADDSELRHMEDLMGGGD